MILFGFLNFGIHRSLAGPYLTLCIERGQPQQSRRSLLPLSVLQLTAAPIETESRLFTGIFVISIWLVLFLLHRVFIFTLNQYLYRITNLFMFSFRLFVLNLDKSCICL